MSLGSPLKRPHIEDQLHRHAKSEFNLTSHFEILYIFPDEISALSVA